MTKFDKPILKQRSKSQISCTYLNMDLYFTVNFIYANHFWLEKIIMKLCRDVEENLRTGSNQEPKLLYLSLEPEQYEYI